MNCTLEVKIKNPDGTITNKTKSVKMYKQQEYIIFRKIKMEDDLL